MTDPTTPPVSTDAELSQQEIDSGKALAILSYIINPIVGIICIATKNNAFSLYHGKQALTLAICIIGAVMISIPLMCIGIGFIIYPLVMLAGLIFAILGIVNAAGGQCKPLPLIGQFADKFFGSIQKV